MAELGKLHVVLSLTDVGAQKLADTLAENDRLKRERVGLLASLEVLAADMEHACHSNECSRTTECDGAAAAEEECSYCGEGDACPSCECGVAEWQQHAAVARDLVAKAKGAQP